MTTHRPAPEAAPEAAPAAYGDAELERLRESVARTAHDLSNALCAVVNYVAFLEQDLAATALPAATRDYLPQLQRAAQRAVDLVNSLEVEPVEPVPPA